MADEYFEYLSKNYVEKLLRPKLSRNKTLYNKVKGSLSNEVRLKLESDWKDNYSRRFIPQMAGGVIDANAWGACLRMHLGKLSDAYIEAWERRSRCKPDFKFFKVLESPLKEELYNNWKSIKKNAFLHNSPDDSDEVKAQRENSINEVAVCVYVELGRDLKILMDRYGVQEYAKEKQKRSQRITIVRDIITEPKYLSANTDSLSEHGKAELATLFDHLNYYQIPLPEKRTSGTATATWEDLAYVSKYGTEGSREELVAEYKRVTAVLYRDIHSKK